MTARTSDCGFEAVEAAFFGLHGAAARRPMRKISPKHHISLTGSVLKVSTPEAKELANHYTVFFPCIFQSLTYNLLRAPLLISPM